MFVKTVPSKRTAPTAFVKIPAWLVAGKENIATLTHSRPNQTSELHLPTVQGDLRYHLKLKILLSVQHLRRKGCITQCLYPAGVGQCMHRGTEGLHSTSCTTLRLHHRCLMCTRERWRSKYLGTVSDCVVACICRWVGKDGLHEWGVERRYEKALNQHPSPCVPLSLRSELDKRLQCSYLIASLYF